MLSYLSSAPNQDGADQVYGPLDPCTGDPLWVEPGVADGFAQEGDLLALPGRREQVLEPDAARSINNLAMGRRGQFRASDALGAALERANADGISSEERDGALVDAAIATVEFLDWTHALDEYHREQKTYRKASEVHAELGPYVEGAIGARNAAHHGIRTVVGFTTVGPSIYLASRGRWMLQPNTDAAPTQGLPSFITLRWRRHLPAHPLMPAGRAIRSPEQIVAFEHNLGGRDVRNTVNLVLSFFNWAVHGSPPGPIFTHGAFSNLPQLNTKPQGEPPSMQLMVRDGPQ